MLLTGRSVLGEEKHETVHEEVVVTEAVENVSNLKFENFVYFVFPGYVKPPIIV